MQLQLSREELARAYRRMSAIRQFEERIEKEFADDTKAHNMIRADTIASQEDATAATIAKARQVIDEQGAALFR